jgi:hypothetical protein
LTERHDPSEEDRADRLYARAVDISFVTSRIATGSAVGSEADVRELIRVGVTHVATVAVEWETWTDRLLRGRIAHLPNGIVDDFGHQEASWFQDTVEFALAALRDPAAKVYVSCAAGINRGPSGAYAVLRAYGVSPTEAYSAIVAARQIAEDGVVYRWCSDAALTGLPCIAPGHWRYSSRVRR